MPKRKTQPPPPTALDDASPVEGLTYREELFAHLYVELANGSEAYRRAGGKGKRPDVEASRLMAKEHVAKRISELRTKRLAKIEFDAVEVLGRLVAQVRADLSDLFGDHGELKPVNEWPDVWRTGLIAGIEVVETFDTIKPGGEGEEPVRALSGYVKKVKVADRIKILELAGRHVDIKAWKDKVEVDASPVVKAMLESFARDTWVNVPGLGLGPAIPAPSVAATTRAVAGVLD